MAAAGLRQVGVRHFPGGPHGQSAPHRAISGTIKALQLKREHRRWYVIVIAETVPLPLPPAGRPVGVDMGVARFLTPATARLSPIRGSWPRRHEVIADLQRRQASARPGSVNRKRMQRALAREWRKVRNRRRDFHRETARALITSAMRLRWRT